ncbi:MAG: hypothetical protein L3K14_03105 [Thermoplasmata archaeon]|nr:hypothetical protein [Thermoplasmata archaeon]
MDLGTLFLVVILVIDVVISIWNAYAAGLSLTLLKGQSGQNFAKAAAVAGLGLAFAGMAYAMLVVFSFIALYVGYLSVVELVVVLSFDFIVFGAMIIGFGLVVTAQSIAIAYRRRSWGSIAVSAWNVFAEVWDITIYVEGFRAAYSSMSGSGRGRVNLYAVIALALLVAFFVTYAAYRHGVRSAMRATEESSTARWAGQSTSS